MHHSLTRILVSNASECQGVVVSSSRVSSFSLVNLNFIYLFIFIVQGGNTLLGSACDVIPPITNKKVELVTSSPSSTLCAMILFYFILLASLAHTSSWFSSQPVYAQWTHAELRTWLEHHNIKIPASFDKPHLYDLVDANWHSTPSPLTHVETGRQWSLHQYNRAQRAFEHIKDDSFDKWDESNLRAFLLEQGVVAPSGPREQLVLLVKNKYRAYNDAAALYASLASASASSAYVGATDAAHSTSRCFSSAVAQATHEVTRAFDDTKDYIYSTWDDHSLRNWLEDHGIVEAKNANTKDELSRLATDYHRNTTSAVWESWSDSYIVSAKISLTWFFLPLRSVSGGMAHRPQSLETHRHTFPIKPSRWNEEVLLYTYR